MLSKPFESRIQDLVYNVDVGLGLRLIKLLLYGLLVSAIIILYAATQFKGYKDQSAMENGQLARNFMIQKKLVTKTVRPASIWLLKENNKPHSVENHPDLINPPLYPVVLAQWFKLWNITPEGRFEGDVYWPEKVTNIFNQICTLITAVFMFFLGVRLFERRVAVFAVSIYLFSVIVLNDTISGLPITFITLLVTMLIYFSVLAISARESEEGIRSWLIPYLIPILLCVAAFYTRYGAVVLVPCLMLFYGVGFRKTGWLFGLGVLVLFLVGITPWCMRNLNLSGTLFGLAPYMALHDTAAFISYSFTGSLNPDMNPEAVNPAIYKKWFGNISDFARTGKNAFGSGLLICLFVSTFFYRFIRFRVHLLRWCLMVSILLLAFFASFFGEISFRLMHMFWPAIVLYAVAFYYLLIDRLQLKAKIVSLFIAVTMFVIATFPMILIPLPPRADIPNPPYVARIVQFASHQLEPTELMCSDMPWATAWYGYRTSVQLPVTLEDFYQIYDKDKRISGIYLTLVSRNEKFNDVLKDGPYRFWYPILDGRIPGDFPLNQGMYPLQPRLEQLFLTDRKRWQE